FPDETTTVRVQITIEECKRLTSDDGCLPVRESNRPFMLPARAVLRKEVKPAAPIYADHEVISLSASSYMHGVVGVHDSDCLGTAIREVGVSQIEEDAKPVGARELRDIAVAEIHAQHICVGGLAFARHRNDRAARDQAPVPRFLVGASAPTAPIGGIASDTNIRSSGQTLRPRPLPCSRSSHPGDSWIGERGQTLGPSRPSANYRVR